LQERDPLNFTAGSLFVSPFFGDKFPVQSGVKHSPALVAVSNVLRCPYGCSRCRGYLHVAPGAYALVEFSDGVAFLAGEYPLKLIEQVRID
jgi:hypothetical protein